ncbi:tRNA splicing endonuclease subunit sen2 [Coemansia sp. BCRC 34301]|nr:tRNA splicing endonuclease subunit sen2 [Coemansia sp. BCRC 34301]
MEEERSADKPRPKRANNRGKRQFEPLPMIQQPAILPRIGQILDLINRQLSQLMRRTRITGPTQNRMAKVLATYLPVISRVAHCLWSVSTLQPKRLFYSLVPGNLLWPTLVPGKVQATIHIVYSAPGDGCCAERPVDCLVWAHTEWMLLWQKGAFGKGILSRSEPTWLPRFTRGGSSSSERGSKFLEDITRQRRGQRLAARDTEAGQATKDSALGLELTPTPNLPVTPDEALEMEPMQLSFYDTLFLCELDCLQVRDHKGAQYSFADLWTLFCSVDRSPDFALKYAAYYYYRSKGWVVRSGLKFGSDFLLYTKSPAQSHAQYSVLVRRSQSRDSEIIRCEDEEGELPKATSASWQFAFSLSRVTSQVRKALVLCYVDVPELDLEPPTSDMKQYQISEFLVQRFNANRM